MTQITVNKNGYAPMCICDCEHMYIVEKFFPSTSSINWLLFSSVFWKKIQITWIEIIWMESTFRFMDWWCILNITEWPIVVCTPSCTAEWFFLLIIRTSNESMSSTMLTNHQVVCRRAWPRFFYCFEALEIYPKKHTDPCDTLIECVLLGWMLISNPSNPIEIY